MTDKRRQQPQSSQKWEEGSEESSLLLNDETDFYLSKDSPPNIRIEDRHQEYRGDSLLEEGESEEFSSDGHRLAENQQVYLLKIGKMIHELTRAKERLYTYQDYCHRLQRQVQ